MTDRLTEIHEKKRLIKEKIELIEGTQSRDVDSQQSQQSMAKLLLRKRILEQQRSQKEQYLKMQEEYIERKLQAERQKKLQQINNEKRMLQLEVAMKRVVFEGIKEKVKGMNSQHLQLRGLMEAGDGRGQIAAERSRDIGDHFEEYLLQDGKNNSKTQYSVQALNDQRLQFYQKKEETIMRKLLLKQYQLFDDPPQIDVLKMTREQLEVEMQNMHLDLSDFMHAIMKEEILEQYEHIKDVTKERININKMTLEQEKQKSIRAEQQARQVNRWLQMQQPNIVSLVREILDETIEAMVESYEIRYKLREKDDFLQRGKMLHQEYQDLLQENFKNSFAQKIVAQMFHRVEEEAILEAVEEVHEMHELAHRKTEDCFRSIFNEPDIAAKIEQLSLLSLQFAFVGANELLNKTQPISKPANKKQQQKNVFETQILTTSLSRDFKLLEYQQKYCASVQTRRSNRIYFQEEEAVLYINKNIYCINKDSIRKLGSKVNLCCPFTVNLQNVRQIMKSGSSWWLMSEKMLIMVTPTQREQLSMNIGMRVGQPCGKISCCSVYPIKSLLGSVTSVLIGFENGPVLKYNYNLNRLTSRQTNLTHYKPLLEQVRSGQQPPFPQEYQNQLTMQVAQTTLQNDAHQFRQFFDWHSTKIIFIGFYHYEYFVTVDQTAKIALWHYSAEKGTACYKPIETFEIRSTFYVYSESANPRSRTVYPQTSEKSTPTEMYTRYHQQLQRNLYTDFKKRIGYFKTDRWEKEEGVERALWKVNYNEDEKKVTKITESYYNTASGHSQAKLCRLWKKSVVLVCERDHILKKDLRTVKFYTFSLEQRRLHPVGLEVDIFPSQRVEDFAVLDQALTDISLPLLLALISGSLLLFSMQTGQIIRKVTEEALTSVHLVKAILPIHGGASFYAVSDSSLHEIILVDNNTEGSKQDIKLALSTTSKKRLK